MSTIRVIIPNYNYGRFLNICVESVLAQTGVNVKVLIIDDASTDDSHAVGVALAARDSRVEYRRHAVNHGHIQTYNEGLDWAADADYGVLLSADDALTPGALRRAQDMLDAHPQVGFVYGRPQIFRGDEPLPPVSTEAPRWRVWPGHEWFAHRWMHAYNGIVSPEVVMRMSVVRQAGHWRLELPATADLEYWMRLALFADVGHIAGPPQAYYRDHTQGMHRAVHGTSVVEIGQYKKAFELIAQDFGESITNLPRLHKAVMRKLARWALDDAIVLFDQVPLPSAEVEALQEIALACDEGCRKLWEWRFLSWRKAIGSRWGSIGLPVRTLRSVRNRWARLQRKRLRTTGL